MQLAALIAAWPMKILSREYGLTAWTAAAVLMLTGCSESPAPSAASNERQAPTAVSVILEPAYQPQLIQAAGSVAASARVEAASRLAAYIEEIPVKEGDLLQKGDVLFKLDPKDVLAAIHAAEGKLKAAQAALKDAELDREKIDALYREGKQPLSVTGLGQIWRRPRDLPALRRESLNTLLGSRPVRAVLCGCCAVSATWLFPGCR